jgi:FG-GAP repeat
VERTGAAFDVFGWSVAINGSTVVVGARGRTLGLNDSQGAVYVFVESGGSWSQQAELTALDSAAYNYFGNSVALNGGTIVVGAPGYTTASNTSQGAAYVFTQNGSNWSQQAELTASDGAPLDEFGWSVALDASTAVVGATHHTVGSSQDYQGAGYVFVESGGAWSQQAEISASDGVSFDLFGYSVALVGSTALVSAPSHAALSVDTFGPGAAYVLGSSGPQYTLSASPNNLNVAQANQGTSTITITPESGFSGSVSFSASGLPSGVTAAFNPNPATGSSTLTLTASATAPADTETVRVIGASGNLTQTTTMAVTGAARTKLRVVS